MKDKTVNKSDIIKDLSKRFRNLPHHVVHAGVDAVLDKIANSLCEERHIEIRGFGSFSAVKRKGRIARNPRTGEPVCVPDKAVPRFKPSKALGMRLNSHFPKK